MQAWRVFQEFIEKIKAENVTEVEGGVFFGGCPWKGLALDIQNCLMVQKSCQTEKNTGKFMAGTQSHGGGWFRWFPDFFLGWFLGSILIFRGVIGSYTPEV